MRGTLIAILILFLLTAGLACRGHPTTHAGRQPHVTHSDTADVAQLAQNVQDARDAIDEAEALRNLHRYAADHRYTYLVTAQNRDTGERVRAPSAAAYPVRASVAIFRVEQPIYSFSFVPRDNRNLEIIVKGA
jgi:hypothetical protein